MSARLCLVCLALLGSGAARCFPQPPPAVSTVTGLVVTADGKTPVPGWTIALSAKSGATGEAQKPRSTRTDDQGRFTFEKVPAGEYVVTAAIRHGHPEATNKGVLLQGSRTAQITLVLKTHRTFRGRVLDPRGLPVAGRPMSAAVLRYTGADLMKYAVPMPERQKAQTDDRGSFQLILPSVGKANLGGRIDGVGWWVKHNIDLEHVEADLGEIKLRRDATLTGIVENKETGKPIGGAQVTLYGQSAEAQLCASNVGGKSADDGRVVVSGLPPGKFYVQVRARGYVDPQLTPLTVGETDSVAMTFRLDPSVRLMGVVLAGPDRQPAQGAKVILDGDASTEQTDANGRFEFASVKKGTHLLTAKLAPYLPVIRSVEARQDTTEVRIALDSEGKTIRGRVTDDAGNPMPGAQVLALLPGVFRRHVEHRALSQPFGDLRRWLGGRADYDVAKADDQGNYEIRGLSPGAYHVLGVSPGLPADHRGAVRVTESGDPPTVDLSLGWNQPLVVRGRLTGPDGKPVSKQRVTVQSEEVHGRTHGFAVVQTDKDGIYRVRMRHPGTYTLELSVSGLGSVQRKGIELKADEIAPAVDLQLPLPKYTREDYGSITGAVYLPDGKTPAESAVVFPFREGQEDWPGASGSRMVNSKWYRARTKGTSVVDAQGRFVVSDLPPGHYGLCVSPWSPEGGVQPRAKALAATAPAVLTDIVVQSRQITGIEAKLGRAGTIRGVARAADTGRPLGGAGVTVYRLGPRDAELQISLGSAGREVYSATDGTFVVPSLPEGTYSLYCWARDRKRLTRGGIAVAPGQATEHIELKLEPQGRGSLTGLLVRPDHGRPAAGAEVYVGSIGQYYYEPTTLADTEGRFHVDDLEEGTHELVVVCPGFARAFVEGVVIAEGEETHLPLRLVKGGSVRGTVRTEDGSPPPGKVCVVLRYDQGEYLSWLSIMRFDVRSLWQRLGFQWAEVGRDGAYDMLNVAPGDYVAQVWVGERLAAPQKDVKITDGGKLGLDFNLQLPTGGVRGRVSRADGEALGDAEIQLVPAAYTGLGTSEGCVVAVEDGAYAVEGIAPGEYYVVCTLASTEEPGEPPAARVVRHEEKVNVGSDRTVDGVDLTFEAGSLVEGIVVDAKTGEPIVGAVVRSTPFENGIAMPGPSGWVWGLVDGEPPLRMWMAMTDRNGRFTMRNVLPGRYTLSAVENDHLPGNSQEVTVEVGKAARGVRIELAPGSFETWFKENRKRRRG